MRRGANTRRWTGAMSMLAAIASGLSLVTMMACSSPEDAAEDDQDSAEDDVISGAFTELPPETTVEQAAKDSCSTAVAKGLSTQLATEVMCLAPGSLAEIPMREGMELDPGAIPFLQVGARDAFVKALDAYLPGRTATTDGDGGIHQPVKLNSAFRALPQQYMVKVWAGKRRCGIAKAASPGASNHETGMAIDVQQYSDMKKSLTAQSFKWFGRSDVVHFTYSAATTDLTSLGVLAFQRLWNHAHPDDVISETMKYDVETAKRLVKAPIGGFASVPTCADEARDR